MKRLYSQTILCGAVALLALCVTGCFSVCLSNRAAGIPKITCQPIDRKIYLTDSANPKSATFHVGVRAPGRLRFAWYKHVLAADGSYREVLQPEHEGALTRSLVISNVSTTDEGLYYCQIAHETPNGLGHVFTRTRLAELTVFDRRLLPLLMTNFGGGIQLSSGQVQSGVPGNSICADMPIYVASLTFTADNSGQPFVSGRSQCNLTVAPKGGSSLNTDQFEVVWVIPSPFKESCCTTFANKYTRTFYPVPNTRYVFVVLFKDPQAIGTSYTLTVNW